MSILDKRDENKPIKHSPPPENESHRVDIVEDEEESAGAETVYDLSQENITDADALIQDSINLLFQRKAKKPAASPSIPAQSPSQPIPPQPQDDSAVSGATPATPSLESAAGEPEEPLASEDPVIAQLMRKKKRELATVVRTAQKYLHELDAKYKELRTEMQRSQHETKQHRQQLVSQLQLEKKLTETIANLQDEAKTLQEYRNRAQQLAEEFRKYQNRVHREKDEFILNANRSLVRELLLVLDSFSSAAKFEHDSSTLSTGIMSGLQAIHKQLLNILTAQGLQLIDSIGKRFDPALHEAMMLLESLEVPDKFVIAELRKGYSFRGVVLRPSLVSIAKNPLPTGIIEPSALPQPLPPGNRRTMAQPDEVLTERDKDEIGSVPSEQAVAEPGMMPSAVSIAETTPGVQPEVAPANPTQEAPATEKASDLSKYSEMNEKA